MKDYVVTRELSDGSVEEVMFRCDYDLGYALNRLKDEYIGGLIGHKTTRGPVRWYVGGLRVADVCGFREAIPYAESSS